MDEEDNSKMGDQLNGLDIEALMGGPLKEEYRTKKKLPESNKKFLQDIGLDELDENGARKIITTEFSLPIPSHSEDGGIGSEEVSLDVPMLAVVNIPTFGIDSVDVTFDMEVKSSEGTPDKQRELDAKTYFGVGPFKMDVNIKTSIASHQKDSKVSDNSKKRHIQLHPKDYGTPDRLARMQELLRAASTLTKVEGEQGKAQGIRITIIEFLSEYGIVPENVKERIIAEDDIDILRQWNKLAARASSIEEFVEKM